ncbi:MAG: prenyltransferase/squalene oxidase repeat-containing protein [Vicinamibacterales bacterium]
MNRLARVVAGIACLTMLFPLAALAQQRPTGQAGRLTPDTQRRLMESVGKASAFLRQQQKADGTFDANPGVTALATQALIELPGTTKAQQLPLVTTSLDYLASLAKPDGGVHAGTIPHYITAVSLSAFAAGGRPQDRPLIEKGGEYLARNMLDEGEGVGRNSFWYGGMGYGGTVRDDGRQADIISLEYALRAMKDAGVAANNPAFEKALIFLQRTQNNSETNDQAWAANDGGFVYYPGFSYHVDGGTKSYGSVSYAGLLSYSWANVQKDDQRVQGVVKWIRDNYTLDENPGMGQKTVYYYYMVFAKALQAYQLDTIVDARGRSHNWREELAQKLMSLQQADGSWVNTDPAEMQNNKTLVTSFTLSAIRSILQ